MNTQPQLSRSLGLRSVISTGAGLALASISYVSLVEMSGHVQGNSGWLALLVAGVVCFLASRCFAELGGLYPSAAGIKLFIEKAFNERVALWLAGLYISTTIAVVGAETYILGNVVRYCLEVLLPPGSWLARVPLLAWTASALSAVAYLNVRGLKMSTRFQDWVSYAMFAGLIAIAILALTRGLNYPVSFSPIGPEHGAGDFLQAVAVGVFLYLGFEWVTPMAEEVSDYRVIPRGMVGSIVLLWVTYALLGTAMVGVSGVATLSQSIDDGRPIPHVIFAQALLGRSGVVVMLLLSLVASLTSFNAGLLTASRFLYALARDRAAPKRLGRIHPRYATPAWAIGTLWGVCVALSVVVSLTGSVRPLIYLGAFASCLIYVTMGVCVIRLRRREPDRPRPYRVSTLAIPGGVAVFFLALGVGLLAENSTALITIALSAAVIGAYVVWGVPRFRAQLAAAGPSGQATGAGDGGPLKRRPRRPPAP